GRPACVRGLHPRASRAWFASRSLSLCGRRACARTDSLGCEPPARVPLPAAPALVHRSGGGGVLLRGLRAGAVAVYVRSCVPRATDRSWTPVPDVLSPCDRAWSCAVLHHGPPPFRPPARPQP